MTQTSIATPLRAEPITPIEDCWRTTDQSVEEVSPEHLGRMTARRVRPLSPVMQGRRGGSEVALGERPSGVVACRPCGVRHAARASGGSGPGLGAVGPGRVWSGPCSGQPASPDRVASEVGSGRSCVRSVVGHAPLQVPLWGTCGPAGGLISPWAGPGAGAFPKAASCACR
ncbi:MAG: hypothetical protein ACI83Y_002548 [Candidatus Azotimanducaceae bacterium]|jgi:hypothetical protein